MNINNGFAFRNMFVMQIMITFSFNRIHATLFALTLRINYFILRFAIRTFYSIIMVIHVHSKSPYCECYQFSSGEEVFRGIINVAMKWSHLKDLIFLDLIGTSHIIKKKIISCLYFYICTFTRTDISISAALLPQWRASSL